MNLVGQGRTKVEAAGKTSEDGGVGGWQIEKVFLSQFKLGSGDHMERGHVGPQILNISETFAALQADYVSFYCFSLALQVLLGQISLPFPQHAFIVVDLRLAPSVVEVDVEFIANFWKILLA